MVSLPTLSDGIALTHFIVAEDVERAARFYGGEPTIVALANSWIIINVGGGPTDDKPSITVDPLLSKEGHRPAPSYSRLAVSAQLLDGRKLMSIMRGMFVPAA